MTETIAALGGFVLTLAVHSTLLLGLCWLLERAGALRSLAAREFAWRLALFGALFTASAQGLWETEPLAGRWQLAASRTFAEAAAPSASGAASATSAPIRRDARGAEPVRSLAAASDMARSPVPPSSPAGPLPNPSVKLSGLPWAELLAALWLAGLLLSLTRWTLAWLALRRPLAMPPSVPAEPTAALLRQLCAQARVAVPRVVVRSDLVSPMALSGRCLHLPAWALERLSPPQLEALLAHEVAHLARRDPLRRRLQLLASAPLFFQPLAYLACRRLDAISELSCDAWAARRDGGGRALAECLALCLSQPRVPSPALAVAMAGRRSDLFHRVERLLGETPMSLKTLPWPLRLGAFAALAAAVLVLPMLALDSVVRADGGLGVGRMAWTHTDDDGHTAASLKLRHADGSRLEVDIDGRVAFNADESDVADMAAGAELDIVEKRDGATRRLKFRSDGKQIARRYFVDGKERALDAEGRAWLARVIPTVMRESGFDAEARVGRILARGGAPAVLDEIALIHGDYVRATYLSGLFARAKLGAAELERAIALAEQIGSDFELRRTLSALWDEQDPAPAQQTSTLRAAGKIESDFELRELLSTAARRMALGGEQLQAWLAAVEDIDSDFESRSALVALLSRDGLPATTRIAVLDASTRIDSDFEQRETLAQAAPDIATAEEVAAYLKAVDGIGSDFERREALVALLRGGRLAPAGYHATLDAIATMGSDFERREVLVELARHMPGDAELIEHYRRVARGLGDFERSQAERALDRFAVY